MDAKRLGRVFNITSGVTVTLQYLLIQNGNSTASTTGTRGGGIYNNGTLIMNNCHLFNNSASENGGGIQNIADLTVTDSNFYNNTAKTLGGGGISNYRTLDVINSNFYYNSAEYGGGIWNYYGNVTVTGSSLYENSVIAWGGGIRNYYGNLIVNGTDIYNNTGNYGGAIDNPSGNVTVINSNIYQNRVNYYGGGLKNYNGNMIVIGSNIFKNTALRGSASEGGGGIQNAGNLIVTSSNIYNNTAVIGGGICSQVGIVNVTYNRIFENFASTSGSAIFCSSGSVNATLNWWGSNNNPSNNVNGTVNVNPWLILNITANPTSIILGNTSEITADILHDSSGGYHDPASGHVPDEIPVNFYTTLGTINSPLSLLNGMANATLNAGTIVGIATVNATVDNQTVNTTVNFYSLADVYVTKNGPLDPVIAGQDILTFTIIVGNNGPNPALNVTLKDTSADLSKLDNVEYSLDHTDWFAWPGTLFLGDIAVDDNQTVWIRGNVCSDALGSINNTANVTTNSTDPVLSNNSANTLTVINAEADVSITKSASPEPVIAGQVLTFTLFVKNKGPSVASNVTVDDNPADFSKLAGVEYSLNGSSWTAWAGSYLMGDMAPNTNQTIWIRGNVTSSAQGTITNTAYVFTNTSDPNLDNNIANTVTTINNMVDVSILKSASPNPAIPGSILTFTLFVKNKGPSVASTVTVNDNSADLGKLSSVEYSLNGSSWSAWIGSYLIGDMAPNTNQTIWIRGTVNSNATGSINNTANVTTTTNDTNLGNNTANTVTLINDIVDVSILKSASANPVIAGQDTLIFTLFVKNNGPAVARAVTVNDNSADFSKLASLEYSLDGSSWSAWIGSYLIGDMAPNTNQTICIRGNVASSANGTIDNTANVTTISNDTTLSNNEANVLVVIFKSGQAMVLNTRTLLTYSKIQDAIYDANTQDGDTLYCNAGTYNEYDILVYKDLVITGPETTGNNIPSVIVDGQKLGRVFNITSDSTVTLQNLLVQNGDASTDIGNPNGGGVYNEGLLGIVNCIFRNNTAEYWGGAIQNMGTLDVSSGSYFTNNSAEEGGAIYNKALIEVGFDGLLTVFDSIFINNTAVSSGGAVYNSEGAVTMHYNRIYDNSPDAICTSIEVNVENNWWGSNSNPSTLFAGSGTVNYSPWLYMAFATNSTTVPKGAALNLTVSFNNLYDGYIVTPLDPAAGHLPDNSGVTFTTDLGNVGSKTVIKNVINGNATATLLANEGCGNAHVSTMIDDQILNSTISITNLFVNGDTGNDLWDGTSPTWIAGLVGPMKTIQAAVNAILSNGTIIVAGGNYFENIIVDKMVEIGNGNGTVTVSSSNTGLSVFTINAAGSGTIIRGLNIIGGSNGVCIDSASNCLLLDNNMTSNIIGMLVMGNQNNLTDNNASGNSWAGICLSGVSQNLVNNNIVSGNPEGIYILNSINNIFNGNVADANSVNGLNIVGGSQNNILNNIVTNNGVSTNGNGFILKNTILNNLDGNIVSGNGWSGIVLDNSSQNNLMDAGLGGNIISGNGNGLVLFNDCNNNIINGNSLLSNLYNGLELFMNCQNNQIYNNNILSTLVTGMLVQYSENNDVTGNTINGSSFNGVALDNAASNMIHANSITGSGSIGMILVNSDYNTITENELMNTFWTGIAMDQSSYNLIQGNTINGNGISQNGIWFQSNCNHNNVTSNNITQNTANGVYIQSSTSNLINYNNIRQNAGGAGIGLLLVTSSSTIINHNTFQDNGWVGTCITSDSNGNTITKNNYISTTTQISQAYDAGTNTYDNGTTGNYWSELTTTEPRPISGGSNNLDNHPSLTIF